MSLVDTIFVLSSVQHFGIHDASSLASYLLATLSDFGKSSHQKELQKAVGLITDANACAKIAHELEAHLTSNPLLKENVLVPFQKRAKVLEQQSKVHQTIIEENLRFKERILELENENAEISELKSRLAEMERKVVGLQALVTRVQIIEQKITDFGL